MMFAAVEIAAAVVAGIIQTVTGFGSGIFMMLFFPLFLPILNASALSSSISLPLCMEHTWKRRKHIRFSICAVPAVFYCIFSTLALQLAPYIATGVLKKVFGGFLIVLSVYFLFFPDKLKIKGGFVSAMVCAGLSGAASGLFGIGGPPMVIYFLATTKDKDEYLGTIQFFFMISGIYTFCLRVIKGIYTLSLVPYTLIGVAAILTGMFIGEKILNRINGEIMKKIIYAFLGLSGLLNLLS